MADIARAIEPQSDRQNAEDYRLGPKVFTVAGTSDYRDEKGRPKVNVHLAEAPERPFKPSATNLRLIAIGWGDDDTAWTGRRIRLALDPEVMFGREKVGGIRVSALSDIPQPYTAKLPVTRGKKAEFRVEILPTEQPPPIPAFTTVDDYRTYFQERVKDGAGPDELDRIQQAAAAVTTTAQNEDN